LRGGASRKRGRRGERERDGKVSGRKPSFTLCKIELSPSAERTPRSPLAVEAEVHR